jgi:dolichyl-phosphate beta-glucosyltransferase
MKLSVIIPAYNEEKRLPKTLKEIDFYFKNQNYDYEILVVDNGSKDNTAQISKGFENKIKGLKTISGSFGTGKGAAVKKGMLDAIGDFRIFTDADNSTSIDQVEKMWPEFENGYDVVIGSRDAKGAVLDPPQPFVRNIILGEGFKLYRKLIIGMWRIEDTQCGFKGFTAKSAKNIFSKCRILDFAFDVEVLSLAKKFGYKIKEVPVYWKNDLDSKVKPLSVIKMALDILRIKLNYIGGKYARKF